MQSIKNVQMVNMRVPIDIVEWLGERAQRNRRSRNAEVNVIFDEARQREQKETSHDSQRDAA